MAIKVVQAKGYNHIFNNETGFSMRFGTTKEEDPSMCPIGPEILDIEVSAGQCSGNCLHCYKSNSATAENNWMSFNTFKTIIDKVSKSGSLCQAALGITDIGSNPDLYRIMEYSRSIGIIPNITVNGRNISDEDIIKLANLCGAVSVSYYNDNDCFGTVKRLTDASKKEGTTLRQVNIHSLLSSEGYEKCRKVIHAAKEDERLTDLGAVVLMTLKPKGNKNFLTSLNNLDKFRALFKEAIDLNVKIGFDSCGCPQVFKAIESLDMLNVAPSCEGCESGCFSAYISVNGSYFPCSFAEGIGEWKEGISVVQSSDFTKDIWYHPRVIAWREKLLAGSSQCDCQFKNQCRPCPIYDITTCYKH